MPGKASPAESRATSPFHSQGMGHTMVPGALQEGESGILPFSGIDTPSQSTLGALLCVHNLGNFRKLSVRTAQIFRLFRTNVLANKNLGLVFLKDIERWGIRLLKTIRNKTASKR